MLLLASFECGFRFSSFFVCYKMTFTVLRLYLKGSYGPVAKAWASSNTSTSAKKYLNSSSCVTTYQVMYSSSITCGRTLYFPAFLLGLAGVLFSKLTPPHPTSLRIACTVRWSDQVSFSAGIPRGCNNLVQTLKTKNANSQRIKDKAKVLLEFMLGNVSVQASES